MTALAEARRKVAEALVAAMSALDAAEPQETGIREDRLLVPLSKSGEILGVSRTTAFQLAESGALPTVELPGVSGRFVRREDLEAFVAGLSGGGGHRRLRTTA